MIDQLEVIVDLDTYPIHRLASGTRSELVAETRSQMDSVGCCRLSDFIRPDAIDVMLREATELHDRTFWAEQTHNPYASKPDRNLPHSAIHNDFPQHKVVFHAHVPDALGVTALKDGFQHIVQDTSMLYGEIGYHDWEGLSLTLEERERLAKNMDGNRVLVMRNHGFLTVGETAGEAFMVMHYFVRGCRALLAAHGSGLEIDPGPTDIWELSKRQYDHFPLGKYEWPALRRMLDQIDPSYKQ